MKNILILFGVIIISNLSNAQSEIETLEKMYRMMENDKELERKAKDQVMSYHYDLKKIVREKSNKLTQAEYDSLNKSIKITWNQITNIITSGYKGSYYDYYTQQKEFLEEWKDKTLDKLYKYIYN